jgi:chromosome segregation ATPase
MLNTLFREVGEATTTLGTPQGSKSEERLRAIDSSTEVSEEDFTRARIHLSNLRCEARTLKEQRDLLEGAEREARERAQTIMKELATCRLKISQVK